MYDGGYAQAMRDRQEAIVSDIIGAMQARDIFRASGDHAAAAALTREIGTYGGGFVSLAAQRHRAATVAA